MIRLIIALMLASFASFGQVETIRYINLNRHIEINITNGVPSGYVEVSAMFRIPLPPTLLGNIDVAKIAETYKSMYKIDHIDTVDAIMYACFNIEPISIGIYKIIDGSISNTLITDIDIQDKLDAEYAIYAFKFSCFQLFPFDNIIGKSKIGTSWVKSQD